MPEETLREILKNEKVCGNCTYWSGSPDGNYGICVAELGLTSDVVWTHIIEEACGEWMR